ncbi:glycosyltransferase [Marivirga sp. S37H4]|uniref:Glycosyltransferase n=1 Tax=Marivirga aurantiaca TaxID=2802615 RepID=A0A934WVU1_9BACT|nr:glycosyltransferase [Marivirga aurantiaca]MBK6263780.1 glycosyltransferase [Marivirga aurantiaca]
MVSVIVCTYNREKYLPDCLKHLSRQTKQTDGYEVLIIDNKSTDSTALIAKEFIVTNPDIEIRYYLEENQGHTFARNRGIKESRGEILTFIDDDAFVDVDFVKNIQDYFDTNREVQALGGKIKPVYEVEEPKWMSKYLLTLVSAIDLGNQPKAFGGNKFPIGANMSFRKRVFKKYGPFNVELGRRAEGLEGGDEKEMFLRMKKNNEIIHYVPSVKIDHIIPEKRTKIEYIKGLGIGVGRSERKRLKGSSLNEKAEKFMSELIKVSGTFVLFFIYLLKFRFQAAAMLVKFRFWVLKGYLK